MQLTYVELERLEDAAFAGAALPPGLDAATSLYYLSLRRVYTDYRDGRINREQGEADKQRLLTEWERLSYGVDSYYAQLRMWKRIEAACTRYVHDRTLENADAFIEAVYDCKLKEGAGSN